MHNKHDKTGHLKNLDKSNVKIECHDVAHGHRFHCYPSCTAMCSQVHGMEKDKEPLNDSSHPIIFS